MMKLLASTALSLGLLAGAPQALEAKSPVRVPESADVLALPLELTRQLETHVIARAYSNEERRQLLIDYMFGASGLDYHYDDSTTRTVSETFEAGVGNCLSFTMLFIAAARHIGLDAYAREVRVSPVWSRQKNVVYRTGHVNAGVSADGRRFVVDFEPHPVHAYSLSNPYRGRRVSDERMLSHYFNNRAAELLGERDLLAASEFVQRAVDLDPQFTSALNTQGVIMLRLGQIDAAERAFATVLEHTRDDPDALINLFNLYRSTDQVGKATALQTRLDSIRSDDPYFQYELGRINEHQGDLDRAAAHYQRAARQLETEHRFHFALARVHYLAGATVKADQALTRAAEASNPLARYGYKAKLQALRAPD